MKFFNWMLRKSHQSTDYSLISCNNDAPCVESGAKAVERDTETLLNHMLESFLSIGTLGHNNPLLSPMHEEEQKAAAAAEPEVEAQAEPKASPVADSIQAPARKQPVKITSQTVKVESILMPPFEEHKRPSCEIIEPLLIIGADNGRRTTLADLLAVDSEAILSENVLTQKKQLVVEAKNGDMVVLMGEYSPPPRLPAITKKVQRLLTNMLKKKIHPDLGQVRSRAMDVKDDEEQGNFLPKDIRSTVSGANYGARSHFSMSKRDPQGDKVVGAAF